MKLKSVAFKVSSVIVMQLIQFSLPGSSHFYCYLFNPIVTYKTAIKTVT